MNRQITSDEALQLTNELRVLLQDRTCCPDHACEVLEAVLAGFALDQCSDDRSRAAQGLRQSAKRLAKRVERGDFTVVRERMQ